MKDRNYVWTLVATLILALVLAGCYTTGGSPPNQDIEPGTESGDSALNQNIAKGPANGDSPLHRVYLSEFLHDEGLVQVYQMLIYKENGPNSWDIITLERFVMRDEVLGYWLRVQYVGSFWKNYEDFIVFIDGSVFRSFSLEPERSDSIDGSVYGGVAAFLDEEHLIALRTCTSFIIQTGNLFTRIPPEGISQIHGFIQ